MAVNRCVCHDVSFVRLIEVARAERLTVEGLRARGLCCRGCAMCEPYVRAALATGVSDLPVMSEAELRAMVFRASDGSPWAGPPSADDGPAPTK